MPSTGADGGLGRAMMVEGCAVICPNAPCAGVVFFCWPQPAKKRSAAQVARILRLKITRADATDGPRKGALKIFAFSAGVPQSVRMTQPLTLLLFERLLPGGQLVNRMEDLGY